MCAIEQGNLDTAASFRVKTQSDKPLAGNTPSADVRILQDSGIVYEKLEIDC